MRGAALLAAWELAVKPLALPRDREASRKPRDAPPEATSPASEGPIVGGPALWGVTAAAAAVGLALGWLWPWSLSIRRPREQAAESGEKPGPSAADREKLQRFTHKLQGTVQMLRDVRAQNSQLEEQRGALRNQMWSRRLDYLDAIHQAEAPKVPPPERYDISDPQSLAPVVTPPASARAREGNFWIGETPIREETGSSVSSWGSPLQLSAFPSREASFQPPAAPHASLR